MSNFENEYLEAMKPFMEIYNLAIKCEKLKNLIEDTFALPSDGNLTVAQQIQFVNCFSDKIYFAQCIYEELEKAQREVGTPITTEELALIDAMNKYYKDTFTINWNILDCLGIENGSDFHKEIMKDAKCPMNSYLSYVDYLCIPAVRNLSGKITDKAYIVGR